MGRILNVSLIVLVGLECETPMKASRHYNYSILRRPPIAVIAIVASGRAPAENTS